MSYELSPAVSGDASGYYADQSDLEARYLAGNVAAFSNLGRDTNDANTSVIQAALDATDREMDVIIRSNGYRVPVATTATEFSRLTDIAVDLAWTRMMKAHVWQNPPTDSTGRELFFTRKAAFDDLTKLLMSEPDFDTNTDAPSYPIVAE